LLANAAIGTNNSYNSFTMQRKKGANTKKKAAEKKNVIPDKKDTTRKEDTTKKEEDTTKKEDADKKEEPVKKEDPTSKDEPIKKEEPAKKTLLSEKRIKEIVERLRQKVAEFRRLQDEGIKPMYKRVPITVMEVPYVMLVINRSRNVASKYLQEIREALGKKPGQKVSVTEFSEKSGIPLKDVREALNVLT
jgi:hypothetical protein